MKNYYGCITDFGVGEVRKIFEHSLVAGGIHVLKGSMLWNLYIEYEKERLKIVQVNNSNNVLV